MLCTQQDIEKRVSPEKLRLWAFQRNNPDPDTDVITEGITWATEEVYAPLRSLYAAHIPFVDNTQPVVLRNIAVSFAVYWFATRHSEYSEIYVQNYRDARKQLESIAKGDMPLIAQDGTDLLDADPQYPLESTSYARSTTAGRVPIFTRSTMETDMQRRF